MRKAEKALAIVDALKCEYPDAKCSLESESALELLIATRLSAQCTDERVNRVTKNLFQKYKPAEDFANSEVEDIEELIHSCGLYKTKARDIVAMCRMLIERFDSRVPDTIEDLLLLPGVGRKTANLIVGDIYGKPSVVVDTHCLRLSTRLGLVNSKDPAAVERELRKLIPAEESGMFCHRLVWHGRAVCSARKPNCPQCCLRSLCKYPANNA